MEKTYEIINLYAEVPEKALKSSDLTNLFYNHCALETTEYDTKASAVQAFNELSTTCDRMQAMHGTYYLINIFELVVNDDIIETTDLPEMLGVQTWSH